MRSIFYCMYNFFFPKWTIFEKNYSVTGTSFKVGLIWSKTKLVSQCLVQTSSQYQISSKSVE
jgi:hypothetical protein